MGVVGGLFAAMDAEQDQRLIAGVDQRVNALRYHRRAAGEEGGGEFGDGNQKIGRNRAVHGNGFCGVGHDRGRAFGPLKPRAARRA